MTCPSKHFVGTVCGRRPNDQIKINQPRICMISSYNSLCTLFRDDVSPLSSEDVVDVEQVARIATTMRILIESFFKEKINSVIWKLAKRNIVTVNVRV